jgi:hypothetical protein
VNKYELAIPDHQWGTPYYGDLDWSPNELPQAQANRLAAQLTLGEGPPRNRSGSITIDVTASIVIARMAITVGSRQRRVWRRFPLGATDLDILNAAREAHRSPRIERALPPWERTLSDVEAALPSLPHPDLVDLVHAVRQEVRRRGEALNL